MEASLRDLLERLDGIAAGTARSHDTPPHLVEEVKEVLEHLAAEDVALVGRAGRQRIAQ